jgi:cytochrome P450
MAFSAAISEDRQPTAEEISKANIPYLDAVIEEVLRFGQPTPVVSREAMVDTTILGHMIPKGTTLLVSSVGPGYHSLPIQVQDSVRSDTARTKYFGSDWDPKDIDLFNPDRWLKKDETGGIVYDSQAGPFLSFGLGPRGCFGRRLAYLEMRMVLTLLLWNFKFRKLEGELASYSTTEAVTVMPKFCYVGLERVG